MTDKLVWFKHSYFWTALMQIKTLHERSVPQQATLYEKVKKLRESREQKHLIFVT